MNLCSRGGPRGGLTIDEYIAVYCYLDTEKVGSQIPTNSIQVAHPTDIGQDSRLGFTPPGLVAFDVL